MWCVRGGQTDFVTMPHQVDFACWAQTLFTGSLAQCRCTYYRAQQDDELHQGLFISLLGVSELLFCYFLKILLKCLVSLLQIYSVFIIVMALCGNKLVEAGPVELVSGLIFDP